VLTVYKTLLIDVQNILQPSFVGPFDVVGPSHLPTMPICYNPARCKLFNDRAIAGFEYVAV